MRISQVRIVAATEMTRSKAYGHAAGSNAVDLSRVVYNNLSSLIKSCSMIYHSDPTNKFDEFMQNFNDFNEDINDLTDQEKEELEVVNQFLGSLGITDEYPIKQDTTNGQVAVNATYHKLNTRN